MKKLLLLFLISTFSGFFQLQPAMAQLSEDQQRAINLGALFVDTEDGGACNTPNSAQENTTSSLTSAILAPEDIRFRGEQIVPRNIVLHWTAGNNGEDIEGLINILRSRTEGSHDGEGYDSSPGGDYSEGRRVQLYVSGSGTVYQLSETIETRPIQTVEINHDQWNGSSIGIEIDSGLTSTNIQEHEQALLNNEEQFNAVVSVVSELIEIYAIPMDPSLSEFTGLVGHHQINGGNSDPGDQYMNRVRSRLISNGVGSDNTQAVSTNCVCVNPLTSSQPVTSSFSLGEDPQERRSALMAQLVNDFGLTPAQAAGPVGNFMVESSGIRSHGYTLPPDVNEDTQIGAPPNLSNGKGYGWAQWSFSRKREFIDFAIANGFIPGENSRATDAANYAFLHYELTNSPLYSPTIAALKETTSPEEAAIVFEEIFERAGIVRPGERSEAARIAFEEYTGISGATGNCPDFVFPLAPTKSVVNSPEIFNNGTTSLGGHPYTAYDIFADTNTEVVAAVSGTISGYSRDKCGGSIIYLYNEELDETYSHLHLLSTGRAAIGSKVRAGERIGYVGTNANACLTGPHLHFDVVTGTRRPGCRRENCPAENQAFFVDKGPELYESYQVLPD